MAALTGWCMLHQEVRAREGLWLLLWPVAACEPELTIGVRADATVAGGTPASTAGGPTSVPEGGGAGEDAGVGGAAACAPECSWPKHACIAGACVSLHQEPSLGLGKSAACTVAAGDRRCWGLNDQGQLGLGDTVPRLLPELDPESGQWLEVKGGAGDVHCALWGDRSLWCWGYGGDGALGQSDLDNRTLPAQVSDGAWAVMAPGLGHSCAIAMSGHLRCWGRNINGELGQGDQVARSVLVTVGSESSWVQISTGWGHTCGIQGDGSLWCWGLNDEGQLGLGDDSSRSLPVRVGPRSDWQLISARTNNTCAIDAARALWCWGSNTRGRLGLGDVVLRREPTLVAADIRFITVSNGHEHTCAVSSDRRLWCWGGTVGDSTGQDRLAPVEVGTTADWEWVETGYAFDASRVGKQKQRLGYRIVEPARVAVLKIGAARRANQQRVAGEDSITRARRRSWIDQQVADAVVRVARCCEYPQRELAKPNRVAVVDAKIRARSARPTGNGAGSRRVPQARGGSHVVSMNVRVQRVDEAELELPQKLELALCSLEHRIDEHGFMRLGISE